MPPEMFDQLEDLARARRKRKQPHMVSDLVREAIARWLPEQSK